MRTMSSTALAAAFAQNTEQVFLCLCTITHPSLSVPIRVVNNNENITSGGFVFQALAFDIELPPDDPEKPGTARLRIDNVDRAIVNALRSIGSPPIVSLAVVLASSPDTIEASFGGMVLRNAMYDSDVVTGELQFEQLLIEPVSVSITPARFPGLFA